MGSIVYDFFSNSILSDASRIENAFETESEERLLKELGDYRQFCLDRFADIALEIASLRSSLKMFTSTEVTPLRLLKQTALYLDQFVIPDPLLKMTEDAPKGSDVTSSYLGFEENKFEKRNSRQFAGICAKSRRWLPQTSSNFFH